MEVSSEKSKIMFNSISNISGDITMNSVKLEKVTGFKYRYMGATLSKNGTSTVAV
ncbi:hypothetical protein DPMN_009075 [Dreissena polymorpha]|uniref:Uncharacterized protein n=1 Tax=Dreissena polymorpha TaxID=45954 RepID=A0A9D4MZW3_DREPO|nr:hypothetical protein DPMN_009075 [Dreissena polymorpha]